MSNRNSNKDTNQESRTGTQEENRGNHKLADNPANGDERISTAGDTANGKNSRTGQRDDEVSNEETRGGD